VCGGEKNEKERYARKVPRLDDEEAESASQYMKGKHIQDKRKESECKNIQG